MRMFKQLWWVVLLAVMVTGCGAGGEPIVVVEGAAETDVAATAYYEDATATAEAALLPTDVPPPTATPFIRPTDDPAVDGDTVIATVAGHDITVEEFRSRVRYERWRALATLVENIETANLTPEDISNPQNAMAPTVIGVLFTLADPQGFGDSVLTQMLRERIMHQEYLDRDLGANTALYNNLWLSLIGLEPTGDGSMPDNLDAAQQAYMDRVAPYSAIREVDLRFRTTVRSEQQRLLDVVGAEADYDPRALEVHHILVETEAEAEEILDLLNDGTDFATLAKERSLDLSARGNGGELGFFTVDEVVASFAEAAFGAAVGELVGPVESEFGFHVIEVLDQEFAVEVQRILLETEADADAALTRLADGEVFAALAEEVSLDADTSSLGFYTPDTVPPAWAMIFESATGDVVGPVQTADGYNLLQVIDQELYRVNARHILVETEAEAEDILALLADGAEFAALAGELSIDPGAQGNGGNQGFLTSDQMPDTMAEALYLAEPDTYVGPIETEYGFHVAYVSDTRVNMLAPTQLDELKALHFQNWLRREVNAVEIDPIWQAVVPSDPLPTDIAAILGDFELAMEEALAAMEASTNSSVE
jgi:parvulin-like peptidyl-prolyl isomerase